MKRKLFAIAILGWASAFAGGADAAPSKLITNAGTDIAIAMPILAGGISLYKNDWSGAAQLTVVTGLTVGTALILKQLVHEQRPDHSDFQSFPSDTTALAASASSYLWGRYGWEYGLPAFVMTQFVSYSRIQAKKHHWYDTLASSALAAGYGYLITTPFQERYNIYTDLTATPDSAEVRVSYRW